jgi:hypothetical protein
MGKPIMAESSCTLNPSTMSIKLKPSGLHAKVAKSA